MPAILVLSFSHMHDTLHAACIDSPTDHAQMHRTGGYPGSIAHCIVPLYLGVNAQIALYGMTGRGLGAHAAKAAHLDGDSLLIAQVTKH